MHILIMNCFVLFLLHITARASHWGFSNPMCIVGDVIYDSDFRKGKGTLYGYLLEVGPGVDRAGGGCVKTQDTGTPSRAALRGRSRSAHEGFFTGSPPVIDSSEGLPHISRGPLTTGIQMQSSV